MKSITIHKIDDETEKALVAIASREGISLNKLIKQLLRESLGLEEEPINYRADFESLWGAWSQEEGAEFNERVKVFDEIVDGDWE